MKFIGELKEKVEAVESDMEKKAIIAHAGRLLTDDELTEVSGGIQDKRTGGDVKLEGPHGTARTVPWSPEFEDRE